MDGLDPHTDVDQRDPVDKPDGYIYVRLMANIVHLLPLLLYR